MSDTVEVLAQFTAVTKRRRGENDAALLDRIENAMYAMRDHVSSPSGIDDIEFYPGAVRIAVREVATDE